MTMTYKGIKYTNLICWIFRHKIVARDKLLYSYQEFCGRCGRNFNDVPIQFDNPSIKERIASWYFQKVKGI